MSVSSHFFWKIILHYDNFFLNFATTATTLVFNCLIDRNIRRGSNSFFPFTSFHLLPRLIFLLFPRNCLLCREIDGRMRSSVLDDAPF